MLILRAGLVGCIAAYMLPRAKLIDDRTKFDSHRALLRFRSDQISKITGIPFKKVKVYKAVYTSKGFQPWNPMLANMYSKKVEGGIHNRSINNLDTVERWVSPDSFHEIMLDNLSPRIFKISALDAIGSASDGEPIISTLPMSELLGNLNIPMIGDELVNKPNSIFVTTANIENCDVNYTIYYPELPGVYRATLQGNKIIVESCSTATHDELLTVADSFALTASDFRSIKYNVEQKYGKMPNNSKQFDEMRLKMILDLTEEYNIYSLGRTATVRSILLDDCYDDIQKIKHMIETPKYQRNIGIRK